MYFRFGSALVLVMLISVAGIALEKRNLELRRGVARQRFQMDALRDAHARIRLETQRLGSPAQAIEAVDRAAIDNSVDRLAESPKSDVNDE